MKKKKFFDYLPLIGYGLLQLLADGCKIGGTVVFLAGSAFLFVGFWFWIFPWESVFYMIAGVGVALGGYFLKKWATRPSPTLKDKEVKDDVSTE